MAKNTPTEAELDSKFNELLNTYQSKLEERVLLTQERFIDNDLKVDETSPKQIIVNIVNNIYIALNEIQNHIKEIENLHLKLGIDEPTKYMEGQIEKSRDLLESQFKNILAVNEISPDNLSLKTGLEKAQVRYERIQNQSELKSIINESKVHGHLLENVNLVIEKATARDSFTFDERDNSSNSDIAQQTIYKEIYEAMKKTAQNIYSLVDLADRSPDKEIKQAALQGVDVLLKRHMKASKDIDILGFDYIDLSKDSKTYKLLMNTSEDRLARIIDEMATLPSSKDNIGNKTTMKELMAAAPPELLVKIHNVQTKVEERKNGKVSGIADAFDKFCNCLANLVGKGTKNQDIQDMYKEMSEVALGKFKDNHKAVATGKVKESLGKFTEKIRAEQTSPNKDTGGPTR